MDERCANRSRELAERLRRIAKHKGTRIDLEQRSWITLDCINLITLLEQQRPAPEPESVPGVLITAEWRHEAEPRENLIKTCKSLRRMFDPQTGGYTIKQNDVLNCADELEQAATVHLSKPTGEARPEINSTGRRCYQRDHIWLEWSDSGLTNAKIRDRWDEENPDDQIVSVSKTAAAELVKKAIKKARLERDQNASD